MPVGKPTPDGEIGPSPRHGSHKGGLGAVLAWNCPACGIKQEGRRPEQGCGSCGAGDPTKSQAGSPKGEPIAQTGERREPVARAAGTPPPPSTGGRRFDSASVPSTQAQVIYRLIEYVVRDPKNVQIVLRNSLVGTLDMGWGTLTGTMIDSLDTQQEDRLRMARMQPGVWLANPEAMNSHTPPGQQLVIQTRRDHARGSTFLGADLAQDENLFDKAARERERKQMEPPDTGPIFNEADAAFADALLKLGGLPFVHTLALALSNVALELEGNMEPLKFMDSAACSRLANALMSLIPSDWDPQPADADTDTAP